VGAPSTAAAALARSAAPEGSLTVSTRSAEPPARAVEFEVAGVVQGVGFRPFVHRLALRFGLVGWVRNESGAVRIRVEGRPGDLDGFGSALQAELPPLARVDRCLARDVDAVGATSFVVIPSDLSPTGRLPVAPDVATCAACQAELRDAENPRHGYPFITCTDCGPRFTVIEEMPYDRARTTMRAFAQCPECLAEYGSPTDRRYHSETNSCPTCGPSVWLEVPERSNSGADGDDAGASASRLGSVRGGAAIAAVADVLLSGRIVAIRGLGGFHLAARADDEAAVQRLRLRKGREAKPLAVMVSSTTEATRLAHVDENERRLLESPQRPIVVVKIRVGSGLAQGVAPGLDSVGLMLAYTPLHHLLLDAVGGVPLVMTSGNASDEPIAIGNDEALERLAPIADAFLLHDREIVARYDDSVLRVSEAGTIVIRRARGYAPMPLPLPIPAPEGILAVGPHLKNTFTLAQGTDAFVSQHIGDLESIESLAHFEDARDRYETLFHLEPTHVVRDLHTGYLSTAIAERSGLNPLPPVQHHHAHVAAVMGEHGVRCPVLGLTFDGTGYGTDGCVWGCEFLIADLAGFRRVGRLRYAPLPGGDRAARQPWRSLLGYASLDPDPVEDEGSGRERQRVVPLAIPRWARPALEAVDAEEVRIATRQIERSLNAPRASSLGRLFDAAAALLGIRLESAYEGQAAMELETLAASRPGRRLPFPARTDEVGMQVLDPVPLLQAMAAHRLGGRSVGALAADFHETIAAASADLAVELCRNAELDTVALGGGCFQNVRLTDGVTRRLTEAGLRVLRARSLSPNDGAVSYGQAVVAAARLALSRT